MRGRILLIGFLLTAIVAVMVVMGLQVFRIQEVVVDGCTQKSPIVVADLAAVDFDQSIFEVSFSKIRENVNASPYFDVLDVGYVFPNKIKIKVHERTEQAYVIWDGQAVIMDENGYVVEVRPSIGDSRVPVITGMYVRSAEPGSIIESENPVQVSAMFVVIQSLIDRQLSHIISEINVGLPSDLFMISTEGFMIKLGNFENMDEKIDSVVKVIPVLVSEGYLSGTINVSAGESATFMPALSTNLPSEDEPQEGAGDPETQDDDPSGQEPTQSVPEVDPEVEPTPEPGETQGAED